MSHSRVVDGRRWVWDVERLWTLARDLVPFDLDPRSLAELEQDCWYCGKTPTIASVIGHVRRIRECSLAHPIILNADGSLMDGGHRVAKAILDGLPTVKAVRFATMPRRDDIRDA